MLALTEMATRDFPRSRCVSSACADLRLYVVAVVDVVAAANDCLAEQVFHQVGAHDDALVERRHVDSCVGVSLRQAIDVGVAGVVRAPGAGVAACATVAEVDRSACAAVTAVAAGRVAAVAVTGNRNNDRVAAPSKTTMSAVAAETCTDTEAGTVACTETNCAGVAAVTAGAAVRAVVGVAAEALSEASSQRFTNISRRGVAVATVGPPEAEAEAVARVTTAGITSLSTICCA